MAYSLTRATLWNLSGYIYLLVASLISIPILVSSLGLADYAHYTLIIATITLASSIDLGLSAAAVRLLSQEDRGHHHHVWASSHLLFFLTGLIAASVATLIVSRFEPLPIVLPIVFAHTLVGHLLSHYLTLPQAHGRFDLYNLRVFVVGTANTFLAALLAYLGHQVDLILLGQLITAIVTLVVLARYSYRHFGTLPSAVTREHSSDLLSFGVKNQLGKLMGQLQAQYGKFLLAPLGSLAISGYSIGQGLVFKGAGGLSQLSTALYPLSSRTVGTRELRRLYYRLQIGIFFLGLLAVALYQLFGLAFLGWWLGSPELVSAVHIVLSILVWYGALLVLTPLPSIILDSAGRPGLTSLLMSIAVLLEIGLALLLLPKYGLLAPAWAGLVTSVLTTPLLLVVTHRVLTGKLK